VAERGRFLALDLGGTNFRVLLITVTENHEVDMKNTIFAISNELMTGSGAKVPPDCLSLGTRFLTS